MRTTPSSKRSSSVSDIPPPLRPTMAEAIAVSDQIRAALGVTPDPRGFAALVASVIERQERASGAEGDAPRAEPPVLC